MGALAIKVEGVGKRYLIGERLRYKTIRESVGELIRRPLKGGGHKEPVRDFWALKDITFDLMHGEVLGIVGRNGAGKSTLLKVLSRITEPSAGHIELHGRVASLLEVGTGFHPELTGRENIFLNGSILGMSKKEIEAKFDAIVAFAGVEKFLDTPVKRYSSGMGIRLGFSVAAHLEPEILVIDEVLAVGDVEFQEKCLRKMDDVAGAGRTVLFVSHNLGAVESLCTAGIYLESGEMRLLGSQKDAVSAYLDSLEKTAESARYVRTEPVEGPGVILRAELTSGGEYSPAGYLPGAPLEVAVDCLTEKGAPYLAVAVGINDARGGRLLTLQSQRLGNLLVERAGAEKVRFACDISGVVFAPGRYTVKITFMNENGQITDGRDPAFTFSVLSADFYENGAEFMTGPILCKQSWRYEELDS